jgi:hypothetical protein
LCWRQTRLCVHFVLETDQARYKSTFRCLKMLMQCPCFNRSRQWKLRNESNTSNCLTLFRPVFKIPYSGHVWVKLNTLRKPTSGEIVSMTFSEVCQNVNPLLSKHIWKKLCIPLNRVNNYFFGMPHWCYKHLILIT